MVRVSSAKESNSIAAEKQLWKVLDTLECGKPMIVRHFFQKLGPQKSILDVGCWNGSIAAMGAKEILSPWSSYTGIEIVEQAVLHFNERHRQLLNTQAKQGDARNIPEPDNCTDAILCLFVLQDMEGGREDGLKVLRELRRVAKPGADALIGLTVHQSKEETKYYVLKKLRPAQVPEKPTYHWKLEDYKCSLRQEGFEYQEEDCHAFGPNEGGYVELYVEAKVRK